MKHVSAFFDVPLRLLEGLTSDIVEQVYSAHTGGMLAGGGLVGFGFGICTRGILRGLQRFGASAEQQIALTLACGYLSFYVANAPCKVSGEPPASGWCGVLGKQVQIAVSPGLPSQVGVQS